MPHAGEPANTPVAAVFRIDDGPAFPGWHRPDVRWNGWACPTFDRPTVDRIGAWLSADPGTEAYWDGDTFNVARADDGELEPEGFDPVTDDRSQWAVGAFCWVWSEVPDEHIDAVALMMAAESAHVDWMADDAYTLVYRDVAAVLTWAVVNEIQDRGGLEHMGSDGFRRIAGDRAECARILAAAMNRRAGTA